MDMIIEFVAEIVLELFDSGAKEVALDRKYPKALRIAAAILLFIFYLSVFGIIALAGILLFKENTAAGIFFIALDVFLIAVSVRWVVRAVRKLKRSKQPDERDELT